MWFSVLSSLWRSRPGHRAARRQPVSARLAVEALEDRCVPAFLAPVTSPGGGWPTHDGVQDVVMADFNSDGRQDVLVAGGRAYQATSSNAVFVGLGNGDGTFQSPAQLTWKKGFLYQVGLADHNGDGNLDPVAFTIENPSYSGGVGHAYVWLGNGDGTFGRGKEITKGPILGLRPAVVLTRGDFDHDGDSDRAGISPLSANQVDVYLSVGGQRELSGSYAVPGANDLVVGDIDRDGNLDIVTAGESVVSVLLGNGDGTFQDARNFPGAPSPDLVRLGDFDGDGWLDVVVASYSPATDETRLFVLFNDGTW